MHSRGSPDQDATWQIGVTDDPALHSKLNQGFFKRVRVEDDGDSQADLAEPFKALLSLAETADPLEADWQTWEASINDNTHEEDLVGVGLTPGPQRGRGLTYEHMVGGGGFEPP